MEAKSREKDNNTDVGEQEHFVEMYSNNHDVVTKPMLEAEEKNLINKNSNCYKCEYRSATKVSIMKHMNPKHALNSVKEVITECTLCDENFNTFKEYEEHK